MPGTNEVHFGATGAVHVWNIAGESLLPKGKRGYVRKPRQSQGSDPGIPKTATWHIGPLGNSRERDDGFLGTEYATLETRFDDLLTSLGAATSLTLNATGATAALSSMLGITNMLGTRMLGGGTSNASPGVITHIKEMNGQLFVAGGAFVTQVNPATWAVVAIKALGAVVRGMEMWFAKLRLGLGGSVAIQTVTGVTASAVATFTDEQISGADTFGKEMAVADDRLWWVRADAAGTNENRLRFTADDFVTQSSGFVVGDPGVGATAIGVHTDGSTTAGSETGYFGFTNEGIAFNLLRALKDAKSQDNGRKIDSQFGWQYIPTSLGLYARRGGTINPVGIGTDSMSGFEGFDGKPLAVLAWRETLLVAYENSAGTTWRILQGFFDPNLTPGSGELAWHIFASRTTGQIRCLGATSTPTLPTVVWGEGANTLTRIAKGRGGRDISDASYTYSTDGGQWFGATMMRQNHLRKTVRWGRFITEDCDASNTWTLAVSMTGGAYTNVGSAVTSSGAQKVVPSTVSSAPTGHTIKPRLTQVAASSTTPAKIRGKIEIGYDERPDRVLDCAFVLNLKSRAELTLLEGYADGEQSTGRQPLEVRLPEDSTLRYGYITQVEETDLTDAGVIGAAVTMVLVDGS